MVKRVSGGSNRVISRCMRRRRLARRRWRGAAVALVFGALSHSIGTAAGYDEAVDITELLPRDCHHAGRYRQEIVAAGFDDALRSAGAFVFSCDQGLIWATTDPVAEAWLYPLKGKPLQQAPSGDYVEVTSRVHQQLGTLLNHLIGGDRAYLEKYFAVAPIASGYQLLPKKQRISQFIQSIRLTVRDGNTVIALDQAQQTMTITIVDDQHYDSLNQLTCVQHLPMFPGACARLLD